MAEENIITIELGDGTTVPVAIAGETPTEQELEAIRNTFFPEAATGSNDTAQPTQEEKPSVFNSSQYYEGPQGDSGSLLFDADPFTEQEQNNPILIDLQSNMPGFNELPLKEQRRLFAQGIYKANEEIYKQQGQPSVLPGVRTQKGTDEDGNPANYFVPSPTAAYMPGTARAIAGGIVEGAKGIARLGEGITDTLRITDPDTDYMKENFPTLPPENDYEALGQEVVSILAGSVGGAGLATKLEKAYGLAPKTAKLVADKWAKVKGSNPSDLNAAAQAFAKTFIIGTGANIGATVTTPQQSDPLFGDEVVEYLGFDPEENRNLTNFADNATFSGILYGLGKAFQLGKAGLGKAFPTRVFKKNLREIDQGAVLFKILDPNLEKNLPAGVFAERARILGEVVNQNSSFKAELLGNADITVDTTTALMTGARDYMRRAYGWRQAYMSAEEFDKFVNESANVMAQRMAALRKARRGGTAKEPLELSEAQMDASMQNALSNTAEELGGAPAVQQAGADLATPIIDDVNAAKEVVTNTEDTLRMAEAGLDDAQTRNYITELLKDSIRNNPMGSSVATKDALDRMTGEQLYNTWRKSFNGYNEAFKNLPDIPLPVEEFVRVIEEAYPNKDAWPNIIKSVTVTDTVSDPLGRLMQKVTPMIDMGTEGMSTAKSPGTVTVESYPEMIERLKMEGTSFKEVFTELRPMIEDRIKFLQGKGLTQQAQQLIGLKRGIDAIAENIGDPAYIQAKTMYAEHADKWLNTEPLRQLEAAYKEVNTNLVGPSGMAKGMPDAIQAGANARAASLESGTLAYQKAFANALDTNTVTPGLAEAYIAESIQAIGRMTEPGKLPDVQTIITGFQKNMPVLQRLAPDQVKIFEGVVQDISMAQAGLMSAQQAVTKAQKAYNDILSAAKKKEASKFVYDLTGNPVVNENAPAAFNRIFDKDTAPNIIQRLVDEAKKQDNPLILQGIQAQYLEWVGRKVTTAGRTGLNPGGEQVSAVKGFSPKQLEAALYDPASPVLKSLSIVFADNLDRAAQVVRFMEIQDMAVNGRMIRPDMAGSSTTIDKDVKRLMDRFVVLGFGVLNPKATVIRNLGEAVTKEAREGLKQSNEEIFNMMIAYPQTFDEIMQKLAANNEKGALADISKHFARAGYGSYMDVQTDQALSYTTPDNTEEAIPK